MIMYAQGTSLSRSCGQAFSGGGTHDFDLEVQLFALVAGPGLVQRGVCYQEKL